MYKSSQETEADEIFNENDDILSGEPTWFKPSVLRDLSGDPQKEKIVDNNVILRSLPLYLYYDGQCFPTGLKEHLLLSSFIFMADSGISQRTSKNY